MRTTIPISITLPLEMLKRARNLAKAENRSMSDRLREAYRVYERKRRWDDLNAFGEQTAATLGITESDVPRLVEEVRKEMHTKAEHRPK